MNIGQIFDGKVTYVNLKKYYNDVFPIDLIYTWLTRDEQLDLANRNFVFSFRHEKVENNQEFAQKYISLKDCPAFKRQLIYNVPYRIDIVGYGTIPPDSKFINACRQKLIFTLKELVFDIDVEPFDWKIVCDAAKQLNQMLRNVFGLNNLCCLSHQYCRFSVRN